MKKLTSALLSIIVLLSLTGCVTRITDFTIISSKNIDLTRSAEFKKSADRITGEDTKPIILLFPIGTPNVKEAMDKAIESVPGCIALVDGVVEFEGFAIIFGYNKYRIKGTCLLDPKLVNASK